MTLDAQSFTPWSLTAEEVAIRLNVAVDIGLSSDEVTQRQKEYGSNELTHGEGTPVWKLFLQQFDDALVKVLLLAAAVSLGLAWFEEGAEEEGLRAFIEPGVILLILILNAAVGVWQESNAESALEALKDMQPHTTRCGWTSSQWDSFIPVC
jgi:P-type Ca2+ transporter type 2C